MAQHTARVEMDTRTVHVLTFTLSDDTLSGVNPADDVEIVLVSRFGSIKRRLSYGDMSRLLGEKF